ncbi:MAG: peptidoglycan-binding domain-containing protein [Eubacteriales bacterium]|nr:peptidoglycan-binding domain-containing protein [Eubacteriales bacterium]
MKRKIALFLLLTLLFSAVPAFAETAAGDAVSAATADYTPEEILQQWYQLGDLLRENGNYPYAELGKGDTGYEVTALQTRLTELGYYHKEIVDNYGSGTYSAMRAFEKANGLTVDGKASVADQQLLFSNAAAAYTATSSSSGSNSKSDATSGATSKK